MTFYGNLVCAALVGLIAISSYIAGDRNRAKIDAGEQAQRDLKAATEAQAAYKSLSEQYRAKEQAQAQAFAAVSAQYQKRIANNETQRLADLTAVESRALVLRDPNADPKACGNQAASTTPGASGSNGAKGADLPAKTAGFLLGLANEADAVVGQLTACQAILRSERQ